MTRELTPVMVTVLDEAWTRLADRLDGLAEAEYLWEPVAGCWSVRPVGGQWLVDRPEPAPDPAPVTTIAWRMWHIGSECLAGYTANGLAAWPLPVHGREWFADPGDAVAAMQTAYEVFRSAIEAIGDDGRWAPLGPTWGPYAESSWLALVVHALDELAHHGAEIALLRDLYLRADDRQFS